MAHNILITSDDGIDSVGLQVLKDSLHLAFPGVKPTIIAPSREWSGAGMSVTSRWMGAAERRDPTTFSIDASPADIIYRAVTGSEEFTKRPWTLVLVGCNAGANLGFDIWHSGTVGAAMVAAKGFGICGMAFSQDMPISTDSWIDSKNADRKLFRASEKVIPDFLRKHGPDSGACYNVNIPEVASRGYKACNAAHYSYTRTPPTSLVPRASNDGTDVDYMLKGFVTVSSLDPRTEPPLKF